MERITARIDLFPIMEASFTEAAGTPTEISIFRITVPELLPIWEFQNLDIKQETLESILNRDTKTPLLFVETQTRQWPPTHSTCRKHFVKVNGLF